MIEINFSAIEKKWQKKWSENRVFEVNEESGRKKFYVLEMFPYPSGTGLHMGHALNYTIGDILARFKKMKGFEVLHPMGFDALGLPAENAAIKAGTHPEEYTNSAIENFIKQQKTLGVSYDWSRTVNTASPDYYKWDQWIFLKMLEKGLAYQKEASVNWCRECNTVLANEQVDAGKCWRHGDTEVEVRKLRQWFFKTTEYADELLEGLGKIDWPERTKKMQENWIGRSEGVEIEFEVLKDIKIASYLLIEKSFDLDLENELGKFGDFEVKEVDEDWGKFFRVKVPVDKEEAFIDFVKNNILVKNEDSGSWYADSCGTTNKVIFRDKTIDMNSERGRKEFFEYGKKLNIPDEQLDIKDYENTWKVFTTRPDTIFGVTFMVVAAGHERLDELVTAEQREAVNEYLKNMHSVSEKDSAKLEKEGVFSGSYAVNPANGERVPIWIGNFVLADYGSGMVMGVPAHDKRDFEFAKKYGIEIRQVVRNKRNGQNLNEAYAGEGEICNSGEFNKLDNEKAKEKITDWLISKNIAKRVVNFKLRDWGISRQRYWGTPIPIVYCEDCGAVPVPEKDLPVRLPKNVRFGDGNPLESNEEWLNVACPKCGKMGRRESDTMDTFVNSSWYFLRYCDSENSDKIFDFNKVKYWNPVDVYIGGAEHACMHLLYSRFYVKFLRDIGALDFDEPFSKLFHQGMLHAEDGRKMSKSLGNVVEPIETVAKYGVDATRWFLVSVASPDKDFDWSEKGIVGAKRFILKVAGFYDSFEEGKDSVELLSKLNLTIKNVEKYYDSFDYRKATIEIRELFRKMEGGCSGCTAEKFLKLIAPIVPHTAEELWETLHKKLKIKDKKLEGINLISNSEWPEADEEKILDKSCSEDLNSKIIERVKRIIKDDTKNVYVYVMPFEIGNVDALKISESVGCEVKVFAVNDSEKVDPEGWSKKAKPGMCSVWVK